MIWFLLLLSLLFAGVDFLFYRVRMRRHSERLRRAFVWFAVFSDALPIVVLLLLKAVPDNTTGWMQAAQWFEDAAARSKEGEMSFKVYFERVANDLKQDYKEKK